ncbi:hypothetical protein PYW07_017071 [Mythimna separata]|uniref:Cathepsin propeptide inhibitor domain-containing protein n=1 Tax=Mythimna separata TaxID=271217 RepID=A0AAD7YVZ6_MYTSE|nr:hypothetical protein PYW07_017071 [Mythimna separata]
MAMTSAYHVKRNVYYDLKDAPVLFEKFIRDYHRRYKDLDDRNIHYFYFCINLVKINKLNRESPLNSVAINHFTDFSDEDWKKMKAYGPSPRKYHAPRPYH